MPNFPHLGTNSSFPDIDNVNVYQYDNTFDYSRYNYDQMSLQLCDVPWDVGEAHVGQRTISGIGNVVYFGSATARDAWFDAIPEAEPGQDPTGKCFRFNTKFKELHREQIIDLPIPYNVAALFNYLVVRYKPFANENNYVEYETGKGKVDWFWFVREVEFVSPNTTRLHLLDDAFQTWIYDVNISGMILERGHAPMFSTKSSKFLENPLANNKGLLCDDVNFGEADIVRHIDALALNAGDMWCCIATSAHPQGTWGTKAAETWKVPAKAYNIVQGVPSFAVFAIEPASLNSFLTNIEQTYPQFVQTVQGVFFAPKNLVTVSGTFTFAGTSCNLLAASRTTLDLTQLNKGLFNYPAQYADIAKLYTSPYAHIEVTDENGNIDVIKVEDTTGNLEVSVAMSLAYPFVTLNAHLMGVGGSTTTSVTYRNITASTFNIQGRWYETLREWEVPTFALTLAPNLEYDYGTYFDRVQAVNDYTTAYNNATASASTEQTNANLQATAALNNANASASTARTNANLSANAAKANAGALADTSVDNTALQVTGNTTINSRSNSAALRDTNLANQLSQASQAYEAGYSRETTNNEIDAAYASAAVGAAGGIAGSVASGAMSGGLIGAVGGLISGAIGGVTSMATTSVSANLKSEQAEATIFLSQNKVTSTNTNNTQRTTNQNDANTGNTDTTNTTATGITANSAATQKANATRTQTAATTAAANSYSTETANATRSYNATVSVASNSYNTAIANAGRDRTNAQNAIENRIAQAALNQPAIFGAYANGNSATTKPIGLFANVVTQSDNAIAQAGDEFLRYGYMYDMQWEFNGNWNIGKYFTYWKLKDFWVSDLQVPDLYMDKLRFFLLGGVTIWAKPEYIGKVSIYDNFN